MSITPDEPFNLQASPALRKSFLSRLLTRPATWRWSLIVVGLLLAIGGIISIYTATSQVVMYQHAEGTVQVLGQNSSGTVVININGLSSQNAPLYLFSGADFTPTPNLALGSKVALVYRSDKAVHPPSGPGYLVVQITVFDSNGKNPQVFTSDEYTKALHNPQGVSAGTVLGIALVIVGLLLAAVTFTLPIMRGRFGKSKKQTSITVTP